MPHHRVHPVDIDSSSSSMSTPPYVMLQENKGSLKPPPYRRNVSRYGGNPHKPGGGGGSFCMRCICCCYCFLFIIILLLVGFGLFIYFYFKPQIPSYKIEGLDINAFDIQPDFNLITDVSVTVKADNPNQRLGFTYGKDSSVGVAYLETPLCSGKVPNFHQGTKNVSMIKLEMKGTTLMDQKLQAGFMKDKDSGRIPLLIMVKVPVTITLGEMNLKHFVIFVNCSMVVDNVAPHKKVGILSTDYKFRLKS